MTYVGEGPADLQRGTEMGKIFLNHKCPFIHEEMARKNLIICSKNTELKKIGSVYFKM